MCEHERPEKIIFNMFLKRKFLSEKISSILWRNASTDMRVFSGEMQPPMRRPYCADPESRTAMTVWT